MNTYELDQPLDLRLKALNLTYQRQPQMITSNSVLVGTLNTNFNINNNNHHHNIGIASSNMITSPVMDDNGSNSSNSTSICSNRSIGSIDGFMAATSKTSSNYPILSNNNNNNNIMLSQASNSSLNQHSFELQTSLINQQLKDNQQNHLRSINIHCQPLNHHEPHPLSRLHPPPSHLQPPPPPPPPPMSLGTPPVHSHLHTIQQHQTAQQQQQQQTLPSCYPMNQWRFSSPPHTTSQHMTPFSQSNFSPQNPSSSIPATTTVSTITAKQQRQLSPQQHNMFTPVKSLSIPSHLLSSSLTFPMLSSPPLSSSSCAGQNLQTSNTSTTTTSNTTSTTTTNNSSSSVDNLHNSVNQSLQGHNQNPLPKTQTGDSATSHGQIPKANSNRSLSSNSSATDTSSINNDESNPNNNNNNDQTTTNRNQTSPITRQHSLISRYNCKPCGIVFSQPDTLRAHQEGYCTKRDRSQTSQIRSQSAVSPTVIQETK